MEESARTWLVYRPTMTVERKPYEEEMWSLPNYIQRERNLFNSATMEAGEFRRAALFENKTIKEIQSELGDTLFFLLLTYHGYKTTGIKTEELEVKHQLELRNQIPERIVESSLQLLQSQQGHGNETYGLQEEQITAYKLSKIYLDMP